MAPVLARAVTSEPRRSVARSKAQKFPKRVELDEECTRFFLEVCSEWEQDVIMHAVNKPSTLHKRSYAQKCIEGIKRNRRCGAEGDDLSAFAGEFELDEWVLATIRETPHILPTLRLEVRRAIDGLDNPPENKSAFVYMM